MALMSREFIAVPDGAKGQIVYKWPDVSIRRYSKAIVDADELALFLNKGAVAGTLPPGRHAIDADEIPFLGIFIDAATGGKAYRAELYFVGTREYTGNKFGGRVDDVQDPHTGLIVTLRMFGQYSIKPLDPSALVTTLTGTVNVTDNAAITDWVSSQLLKVARTEITRQILGNGWPILGLSAYTPQLSDALVAATNAEIARYGLAVIGLGNFDINLSDEDEHQLKALAKDTAYSRLAGSFQQYAAGEAMLGAGEGMAQGGGTGGALLAAGFGAVQGAPVVPIGAAPPPQGFAGGASFAGPVTSPPPVPQPGVIPPASPPPVPQPGAIPSSIPVSQEGQLPGSGPSPKPGEVPASSSAPAGVGFAHFCTECGTGLNGEVKFCPNCGTKVPT